MSIVIMMIDQCERLQLPYEKDDIEIRKTLIALGVENLD